MPRPDEPSTILGLSGEIQNGNHGAIGVNLTATVMEDLVMFVRHALSVLLTLLFVSAAQSQTTVSPQYVESPASLVSKIVGGALNDTLYSLSVTEDSKIFAVGQTSSDGAGAFDGWVLLGDGSGELIWERLFGRAEWDTFRAVEVNQSGNAIIAGATENPKTRLFEGWLLEVSSGGEIVRDRKFSGEDNRLFFSVTTVPDGGVVAAGTRRPRDAPPQDAGWIVKIDGNGREVWQKTIQSVTLISSVLALNDGTLIVGGQYKGNGWLARINQHGNIVWEKIFDTFFHRHYGPHDTDLTLLYDGTILASGFLRTNGIREPDGLLMLFKSDGTVLWENSFGGSEHDALSGAAVLANGVVLSAGSTQYFDGGPPDAWIMKHSPDGSRWWNATFGRPDGNEEINDIAILPNGRIVAVGEISKGSVVMPDGWILWLDESEVPSAGFTQHYKLD